MVNNLEMNSGYAIKLPQERKKTSGKMSFFCMQQLQSLSLNEALLLPVNLPQQGFCGCRCKFSIVDMCVYDSFQAIKLVGLVYILYIFTWGPYIFHKILHSWGLLTHAGNSAEAEYFANAMSYINSCFNPFLYAFASK